MSVRELPAKPEPGLGASARASLLWGGGAMVGQDVIQFATMLVLVRLLGPSDYGAMVFAQAILGVIFVVSGATFGAHALQMRDPAKVDWQAHFTFAAMLNSGLLVAVLGMAYLLSTIGHFAASALPLAFLSLILALDVPASFRYRMLQSRHDWKRYRILTLLGSVLSSCSAIAIAVSGGGIWALVVQPVLALLPPAIDLLLVEKWRPDWSWSLERYREQLRYGMIRAGSGSLFFGRTLSEQTVLATLYNFTLLGTFTRAIGLATILAGRIGQITSMMLLPVLTRAETGSEQFRRNASLVLQGVVWTTVPAAAIIALMPQEFVGILYGPAWREVTPLLPLASISVGIIGINFALYNLLLANNQQRGLLKLDVIAASLGVAFVFALAGYGPRIYLAGMIGHGIVMLSLFLWQLTRGNALDASGVRDAFFPPLAGAAIATAGVFAISYNLEGLSEAIIRLVSLSLLFGVLYIAVIRLAFADRLARLVEISPGGEHIKRILMLRRG